MQHSNKFQKMDRERLSRVATNAFFALALLSVSSATMSTDAFAAETNEKCYGIVKAGMNDCATVTASCASSATRDRQRDAFVFVPKGLCKKIAGGYLDSAAKVKTKAK